MPVFVYMALYIFGSSNLHVYPLVVGREGGGGVADPEVFYPIFFFFWGGAYFAYHKNDKQITKIKRVLTPIPKMYILNVWIQCRDNIKLDV